MFDQSNEELFNESIEHPEIFWDNVAKEVSWSTPYTDVLLDKFTPTPKWFVGGQINMSYNCLDKNVEEGYGDEVAMIHDSPITGCTRQFTYKQLLESASLLTGVLVNRCGIKKGDIVALYFPVVPECLIAMLACTRIGAIYATIYGGFSVTELTKRLSVLKPIMIMTCNAGPEGSHVLNYKEKIDRSLASCEFSTKHCLVYNRPNFKRAPMTETRDLDWDTELMKATPHGVEPMESDHPMFIIFTSGTTGDPKGLVQLTGSAVVYNLYAIKHLYGLEPKDTVWMYSDFSWIIGQTLQSYGALMGRTRSIIYEGSLLGTPDNAQFARVLNWHKVKLVLCLPRILRILRRNCSETDLELTYNGLSAIVVGGEGSDKNIRDWASAKFGCEVHNAYGLTEMGGPLTRSVFGSARTEPLDNSVVLRVPSLDIKIVDRDTGTELPRGSVGRLLIKLPTMPSMMATIYNNYDRYFKTYFEKYPGYFDTTDAGIMLDNGTVKIRGRDGDMIDTGGARIWTSTVEKACMRNSNIAEAIIVAFDDKEEGPVPFVFLIPKNNVRQSNKQILDETTVLINEKIGEVACFGRGVIVDELPTTSNGKVHTKSLMAMVNRQEYKFPASVINEWVYQVIHDIVTKAGYSATLPKRSP